MKLTNVRLGFINLADAEIPDFEEVGNLSSSKISFNIIHSKVVSLLTKSPYLLAK